MNIHVLTRKEEIEEAHLVRGSKIAVAVDVLLATTTIAACLEKGAVQVIPAATQREALEHAASLAPESYILAGEEQALPIEGFVYPGPISLSAKARGKTVILVTTNGTTALRRLQEAEEVYAGSLLNAGALALELSSKSEASTLLITAAGNAGEISFEDMYGAGCLIEEVLARKTCRITDAAQTALSVYRHGPSARSVLASSLVGKKLLEYNMMEDLIYASNINSGTVICRYTNNRITNQNVL